jgi:hypothetical protein
VGNACGNQGDGKTSIGEVFDHSWIPVISVNARRNLPQSTRPEPIWQTEVSKRTLHCRIESELNALNNMIATTIPVLVNR